QRFVVSLLGFGKLKADSVQSAEMVVAARQVGLVAGALCDEDGDGFLIQLDRLGRRVDVAGDLRQAEVGAAKLALKARIAGALLRKFAVEFARRFQKLLAQRLHAWLVEQHVFADLGVITMHRVAGHLEVVVGLLLLGKRLLLGLSFALVGRG